MGSCAYGWGGSWVFEIIESILLFIDEFESIEVEAVLFCLRSSSSYLFILIDICLSWSDNYYLFLFITSYPSKVAVSLVSSFSEEVILIY